MDKDKLINSHEYIHLIENASIEDIHLSEIISETYEDIDIILDQPVMHIMIDKFNLNFNKIKFNSHIDCILYIKEYTMCNIFAMFSYLNKELIYYSTPIFLIKNNKLFNNILKFKYKRSRVKKINLLKNI